MPDMDFCSHCGEPGWSTCPRCRKSRPRVNGVPWDDDDDSTLAPSTPGEEKAGWVITRSAPDENDKHGSDVCFYVEPATPAPETSHGAVSGH